MSESTMFVRDPTGEPRASGLQLAPRPDDVKGLTVLLIRNSTSWKNFGVIVERYQELLKQRCGAREVLYHLKPGGSFRPMPASTVEDLAAKADIVIAGMGN